MEQSQFLQGQSNRTEVECARRRDILKSPILNIKAMGQPAIEPFPNHIRLSTPPCFQRCLAQG